MSKPEVPIPVVTEDGSHTLFNKELDEHYHSVNGAITESKHVFLEAGLRAIDKPEIKILEMGFGTGLNCLLTIQSIRGTGVKIHYTAIEKYPLLKDITDMLNYNELIGDMEPGLLKYLHQISWNSEHKIQKNFSLVKLDIDLLDVEFEENYDLVYFDAFAPDKQPELWSTDVFSKLYHNMSRASVITTYSSKGQVRRNMAGAGFRVEKLPGPPGKREMTRAWKE